MDGTSIGMGPMDRAVVGDNVGDGGMGDEVGADSLVGIAVGTAVGSSTVGAKIVGAKIVGDKTVGVDVPTGPHARIARKSIKITSPKKFLVFIHRLRSGRISVVFFSSYLMTIGR